MYRLVLLDLDDTLYDTKKAYREALRESYRVMRKYYPFLSWELFESIYEEARSYVKLTHGPGPSRHNRALYFQKMLEILGVRPVPEIVLKLVEAYFRGLRRSIKPFEGVKTTLYELKRHGVKVGIVTNQILLTQLKKLSYLGLGRYIDFIVSSEEAGFEKPYLSIFLLALYKGKSSPEETVMVGDNPDTDIAGAKSLGMTTVKVGDPHPDADYNIEDFRQLLDIVLGERRPRVFRPLILIDASSVDKELEDAIPELSGRYTVAFYGESEFPVGFTYIGSPHSVFRRIVGEHRWVPWRVVVVSSKEGHLRAAHHYLMRTVLWKKDISRFLPDAVARTKEELVEALRSLL